MVDSSRADARMMSGEFNAQLLSFSNPCKQIQETARGDALSCFAFSDNLPKSAARYSLDLLASKLGCPKTTDLPMPINVLCFSVAHNIRF